MTTYNITLTNAENFALSFVAMSQDDWIQNVVHDRCRIAIEEIVKICVEKCIETNTQVPNSKDAMVELAFAQGWVKSAADRQSQQASQTVGASA